MKILFSKRALWSPMKNFFNLSKRALWSPMNKVFLWKRGLWSPMNIFSKIALRSPMKKNLAKRALWSPMKKFFPKRALWSLWKKNRKEPYEDFFRKELYEALWRKQFKSFEKSPMKPYEEKHFQISPNPPNFANSAKFRKIR